MGHDERVLMYLKKKFSIKAKKKLVPSKTPRSVSQLWISLNFSKNQHVSHINSFKKNYIWLRTVLACAESLISRIISSWKRIFKKTILTCLLGAQMGSIHKEKNAKKSPASESLKKLIVRAQKTKRNKWWNHAFFPKWSYSIPLQWPA